MSIQTAVKSIQDIMRKDAGVDGDAQRLSQLVWMLFLKIIDDAEDNQKLMDPKYRSPIPEKFRWRNWAKYPEGITGDELLDFINNKLFKALKSVSADPERNPRGFLVREMFDGAFNYMKDGTLIRQVINKLNEVDFNKTDDRHHFNEVYEHMLKELQSAGNAGEFYTPRPLTKFVVDTVDPKLGEIVFDPACGTGGFLVNTLEYARTNHEVKTKADERKLQVSIRGVELKSLPYFLAITNMILHGVEVPNIVHDDSLSRPLRDIGPKNRVDVIMTNPPFGGVVKDGTQKNFPVEFQTKDTALLFLVLFIHLLKPNGRAGVILPDGVLFGEEGAATAVKKKLLAECNVHTIVRLPPGVFNPYSPVNTNLVFFNKGTPTKEIWYYQLPLPEGMKQYTKNRGITHEEFDPVRRWWKNRRAGDHAWKVSIGEIEKHNYNLDFKNPNGGGKVEHADPKEILKNITGNEKGIEDILNNLKHNL